MTVTAGSDVVLDTTVLGILGTAGVAVTFTNTSGVTSVTKGQSLAVAIGSCATAQVVATATLTFTPTV